MQELGIETLPDDLSLTRFIEILKQHFKRFLAGVYVDTFTLERDHANTYCLFFFTKNIKGFEVMLKSKWDLDDNQGRGFRAGNNLSLFSPLQASDYPTMLGNYIRERSTSGVCTNNDVYLYGLEQGYLPKHSKEVLDDLKKQGILKIESLTSQNARGYYLNEKEKKVKFSIQ